MDAAPQAVLLIVTDPPERTAALRQQPPFANRMLFSAKATWAKDSHELRSPSLHHPISAQSSLLTDDYGGDSEALISDMTEQCRYSCCDHYPLVRNRRKCPEDKWLLDVKRGHQVLFLRLFTKKLMSDPMIFFGWKPPSEATRSPLDRRETCPDHSAGSDSATALVFTFRPRAANHRQMT